MYILASAMNNYLQLFCPTKCQLRKILIARSDAPEICSARFCQFFNGSLLFFFGFFAILSALTKQMNFGCMWAMLTQLEICTHHLNIYIYISVLFRMGNPNNRLFIYNP